MVELELRRYLSVSLQHQHYSPNFESKPERSHRKRKPIQSISRVLPALIVENLAQFELP